jgi:hypothetical protein
MVRRRPQSSLPLNRTRRQRRATLLSIAAFIGLISGTFFLEAFHVANGYRTSPGIVAAPPLGVEITGSSAVTGLAELRAANGRPPTVADSPGWGSLAVRGGGGGWISGGCSSSLPCHAGGGTNLFD